MEIPNGWSWAEVAECYNWAVVDGCFLNPKYLVTLTCRGIIKKTKLVIGTLILYCISRLSFVHVTSSLPIKIDNWLQNIVQALWNKETM